MAEEEGEQKEGKVRIESGEVTPEQMEEIEAGDYFTIAQIAEKLRYTTAWILELVHEGRIKGVKPLGGRWRIPRSEYERLIKEGIPPLPREQAKPPVTEIPVEDKRTIEKVKEPEKKKEEEKRPSIWPFDFSPLFGKKE